MKAGILCGNLQLLLDIPGFFMHPIFSFRYFKISTMYINTQVKTENADQPASIKMETNPFVINTHLKHA